MGTTTVVTLMRPFLSKGYCVTVDNYYTSLELVDRLLQHKPDVYGTVCTTRKEMSPSKDLKLKKEEVGAYK